MDAEGDFFDSRTHFNWEQVRQRIDIALHTITPQPRMFCVDTGSNTFIVNHLILQFRNLRKLKKVITVGTATPSGTLTVKQIFDVGQVVGVRYCPEASASLLPSDIINDCAVEVHAYKINGRYVCALVANGKFIGGEEREYISHATRHNGMWWISEEQMSDIVFRKGFPVDIFLLQLGKNKSSMCLGIWHEINGPPEPRACVNHSAATTSRLSAARTVIRVEEIEDESDGEAAAEINSEEWRDEQHVKLGKLLENFEGIDNWENRRAFDPSLKMKVITYVRVWSRIFRRTSEGIKQEVSERCFHRTPYGDTL